jgi:hypothetical protein
MLAGVFEGLLSPWHIVIIAFVVFMVFGPKKLAARWEGISDTVQHLMDDDGTGPSPTAAPEAVPPPKKKERWARRLGRRLTRLRRRGKRRAAR